MHKEHKLTKKYMPNGCIPSPPDNRDYTFERVALTSGSIPKTYLNQGMPILDQGSVGSCVAHCCATAFGYGELTNGKNNTHDMSRGFVYANRRDSDYQGEGMNIRQALKQFNHCGDCEQADFPWNETYPKVKSRLDANKEMYLNKAEPYKILNYFRCYNEDEIKLAVINNGAVIMSMPLFPSFASECPMPGEDEVATGYHAMCIVGWDEAGWIIQNSWSKSWGNKGRLHVPYEYPITEFWGMTVDPSIPEAPKKQNWLIKLIKELYRVLKALITKKK